jgi:hypothetical protein
MEGMPERNRKSRMMYKGNLSNNAKAEKEDEPITQRRLHPQGLELSMSIMSIHGN